MLRNFVPIRLGPHGARDYLAWVAYPDVDESENRARWKNAVVAAAYKAHRRHPPPEAQGIKVENINGIVGRGFRRIHCRRIPAAIIAREWIEGERVMRAIRGVLDTPAANAGLLGAPEEATIKRAWSESRPALAMAVALSDVLIHRAESIDEAIPRLAWVDHAWVDFAIMAATIYAVRLSDLFPELLVPIRVA